MTELIVVLLGAVLAVAIYAVGYWRGTHAEPTAAPPPSSPLLQEIQSLAAHLPVITHTGVPKNEAFIFDGDDGGRRLVIHPQILAELRTAAAVKPPTSFTNISEA